MNINTRKFRLSSYFPHKVMGVEPRWELDWTRYRSADHDGKQTNYSLTLGLATIHLKWRHNA